MKFKCPKCGCCEAEEITVNVTQSTVIVGVDEDGLLEYGDSSTEGGDIDHFQCAKCGEVIKEGNDATGKAVKSLNGMAEWLQAQATL